MAGHLGQQTFLAALIDDDGRAAQRQRKGPSLQSQGFELRRHQTVAVLIQVEKAQDGDEKDEDVDQKNAPGEGRMPALLTPKALDLTRHVAIFIADVKPLDAAAQLAIAPRFPARVRDRRAKHPIAGQIHSHRRRLDARRTRADRDRRALFERVDPLYIRSPYNGIQLHKGFLSVKNVCPRL